MAKNRLHMDLNVSGGHGIDLDERRRRVDAEVARLMALAPPTSAAPSRSAASTGCG